MAQISAAALLIEAQRVAKNAYAPYSGCHVGAAAQFSDGAVYCGTNVENASYGLTICAERSAIFAGVSAGRTQLLAIALSATNKHGEPLLSFTPCGACRQVIAEFGRPDTEIIVDGVGAFTLAELLPRAFEF